MYRRWNCQSHVLESGNTVVNQRWRLITGSKYEITHILACIYMIAAKFQRLYPYFRGPAIRWMEPIRVLYGVRVHVGNQRCRPLTGSGYGKTYDAACRPDSVEILTATRIFSGSSNSMMLLLELSDVRGLHKSKIAATKPEILIAHFRFLPV